MQTLIIAGYIIQIRGIYLGIPHPHPNRNVLNSSLREKCLYSELHWSIFSRIWTEYGEILQSFRIQSECEKFGPE